MMVEVREGIWVSDEERTKWITEDTVVTYPKGKEVGNRQIRKN
jgi:hypothetical protein